MTIVSVVTLCCDDANMCNHIKWLATFLACGPYILVMNMTVDFVSRS